MEMIEVDGLRIGYERAGDGPPLVLLDGYVGDGLTTWRRQIEELSAEFTVVPGTRQGSVDHPIPRNRLAWPAMPTAWPGSSTGSA